MCRLISLWKWCYIYLLVLLPRNINSNALNMHSQGESGWSSWFVWIFNLILCFLYRTCQHNYIVILYINQSLKNDKSSVIFKSTFTHVHGLVHTTRKSMNGGKSIVIWHNHRGKRRSKNNKGCIYKFVGFTHQLIKEIIAQLVFLYVIYMKAHSF